MQAYFHKMSTPQACLVIQTSDEQIGVSISADDSCGVLDNYRRFNIWYWDKDKKVDVCEDGFNFSKVIFWLLKIKRYERIAASQAKAEMIYNNQLAYARSVMNDPYLP